MADIGFPELIVILVIALLMFGPSRLPDMGRSLGRALREFRNAIRGEGSPGGSHDASLTRQADVSGGSTHQQGPTTALKDRVSPSPR